MPQGATGAGVHVRTLRTVEALRAHVRDLGIDLPVDDEVEPSGALGRPLDVLGHEVANRFCVLPMEGWDATTDGRPSDLVRRRWRRFGASGAGIVWAEATAVRPDGRANPRQLVIDSGRVDDLRALRLELLDAHREAGVGGPPPMVGLQLTHSGRWSRPEGAPRPAIAYRHPVLDDRVGATDADLLKPFSTAANNIDRVNNTITVPNSSFEVGQQVTYQAAVYKSFSGDSVNVKPTTVQIDDDGKESTPTVSVVVPERVGADDDFETVARAG